MKTLHRKLLLVFLAAGVGALIASELPAQNPQPRQPSSVNAVADQGGGRPPHGYGEAKKNVKHAQESLRP